MRFSLPRIDFRDEKRKKMAIYALAAVLVIAVVFGGMKLTGYVTNSLSQQLDTAKSDLATCTNDLTAKTSAYNDCSNQLGPVKASLTACVDNNTALGAETKTCETDNAALKDASEKAKTNYDELSINAAKDICCARGVQTAHWSIVDNFITCVGGRTVDCSV